MSFSEVILLVVLIPVLATVCYVVYHIEEWVLNGFKDIEEDKQKKRHPLQIIAIVALGLFAMYFISKFFDGCGADGVLYDNPRRSYINSPMIVNYGNLYFCLPPGIPL